MRCDEKSKTPERPSLVMVHNPKSNSSYEPFEIRDQFNIVKDNKTGEFYKQKGYEESYREMYIRVMEDHPGLDTNEDGRPLVKSDGDFVYIRFHEGARDMFHQFEIGQITLDQLLFMFSIVCHIHKNGFIHSDLKLENFIIFKDEEQKDVIKLIDFEGCQFCSGEINQLLLVTEGYIAPEVLYKKKSFNGFKTDVYSMGIILYICIATPMYQFNSPEEFYTYLEDFKNSDAKCNTIYSADVINKLLELIQNMTLCDPQKRYTMDTAYQELNKIITMM